MNNHNLNHLADDVEHSKTNLSSISAFPFENYLGKIKRLIKGRNNSLSQLVRRVSEQKQNLETIKKNTIHRKQSLIINPSHSHDHEINLKSVILYGVELSSSRTNNIVKLNSSEILSISNIKKRNKIFIFMVLHSKQPMMFSCSPVNHQKLELRN